MATGVRPAAGRLIDSQPGKGGTPLENLLHRVDLPIVGAKLELRQPFNGTVYKTVSDINGHFAFDTTLTGTYVLHIEEGTALGGSDSDSTNLLINLGKTAKPWTPLLKREAAEVADGTSLGLEIVPS